MALVTIDGDQNFEATLTPGTWNGFVIPSFELEVVKQIALVLEGWGDDRITFEDAGPTYHDEDGARLLDQYPDGTWDVGGASWTWVLAE